MTVTFGSTTVFGGSTPAPAAGGATPAPAAGGFSFGASTPAPGAPAPAPAGGAFSFGGGTPAPAAGGAAPAPSAGGFSFASGSTPAPAPGGGLFGTASSSAPTGGFGAFGSTPAPAPGGGGLFGATPAPSTTFGAPAPTPGSLFGATAPPPFAMSSTGAPIAGAASTASSTPQTAAALAHFHTAQRQEAAKIESALMGLHTAYTPTSTPSTDANPLHIATPSASPPNVLCRFKYFFYDPLTSEQRQNMTLHGTHHHAVPRPSYVYETEWNDALARNPDPSNYAPVCIIGSEALAHRASQQQERAKIYSSHVSKLRSTLEEMKNTSVGQSEDSIRYASKNHEALRKRLLDVMRKVEIARCMNLPLQPAEKEAEERMKGILRQLNHVGKVMDGVEMRAQAHAQYLRSIGGGGGGTGKGGGKGAIVEAQSQSSDANLTEEDKTELFTVMNEQRDGLERLVNIVKKDVRDVNILKEEIGKINMAGGGDVIGQLPPSLGRGQQSSVGGRMSGGSSTFYQGGGMR